MASLQNAKHGPDTSTDVAPAAKKPRSDGSSKKTIVAGIPAVDFNRDLIIGSMLTALENKMQPVYAPKIVESTTNTGYKHYTNEKVAPLSSANSTMKSVQQSGLPHFASLRANCDEKSHELQGFSVCENYSFSRLPSSIRDHVDAIMKCIREALLKSQNFTVTTDFSPPAVSDEKKLALVDTLQRTFLTFESVFVASDENVVMRAVCEYVKAHVEDADCIAYFDSEKPLIRDGVRFALSKATPDDQKTLDVADVIIAICYVLEFSALARTNFIIAKLVVDSVLTDEPRGDLLKIASPEKAISEIAYAYLRCMFLVSDAAKRGDLDLATVNPKWMQTELDTGLKWHRLFLCFLPSSVDDTSEVSLSSKFIVNGNARFASTEDYYDRKSKQHAGSGGGSGGGDADEDEKPYAEHIEVSLRIPKEKYEVLGEIAERYTQGGVPNSSTVCEFINWIQVQGASAAPGFKDLCEAVFRAMQFGCNSYIVDSALSQNFQRNISLVAVMNNVNFEAERKTKPTYGRIITSIEEGAELPENAFLLGEKPTGKKASQTRDFWVDKLISTRQDEAGTSRVCRPFHVMVRSDEYGIAAASILDAESSPTIMIVPSVIEQLNTDEKAQEKRNRKKRHKYAMFQTSFMVIGCTSKEYTDPFDAEAWRTNSKWFGSKK